MPNAYQHRPLSSILAPAGPQEPEGQTSEQEAPAAEAPALPEKYQGKTAQEIAEMHMNAEKELGRVRNEVGTYRGLVQDLTSLQRTAPEAQPAEKEKIDVSGDDLLSDPAGTVDKIVSARLAERDQQENELRTQSEHEVEASRLMADFPNIDAIVASEEFQTFTGRTSSRQQDFMTAAQGEGLDQVRAARRLLEDFADFKSQTTPAADPAANAPQNPSQPAARTPAADQRTEGSGPAGAVATKELIYEADVIKLINSDPAKYRSPSFQKELTDAIRERRFVKSG